MSIAPRETKCASSCQRRSGQTRFGHLVNTEPSALTVGVPHTGQRSRAAAADPTRLRSSACGAGEMTCGITSPARRTITSSPTRTSLRSRSSSLCSVAFCTVTPPTWTGSRRAHGCRSPNLPTFHSIAFKRRHRRGRRELPGDRPARIAAHDAEPALELEVVDLHDDAVDLEVQRAAAVLPGEALRDHLVLGLEPLDVAVDAEAARAQPLQRLPVRLEAQALDRADGVAPHGERALGGELRVELADRPGGRVARVHERRQPRPRRGARSGPRSR